MKMKSLLIPLVCVGLAGAACSNQDDQNKPIVVDTQALKSSGKTLQESAENLALAGEQLVSPISYMYADIVFDLALEANPDNKRAQFYKALIKPMMMMKGVLTRIKPAMSTAPEKNQTSYNQFISNAPESALKTFLLDGEQDIKTEEDALKFMDSYRAAWEDLRIFMKKNKDLNMEINIMTLPGYQSSLEKATGECSAKNHTDQEFIIEKCSYLKALKINISRADIEALQQIAAGMQIYQILGTSYSLDGVREFSEKNGDKILTSEEVIEHFKNNTTAGKLRHNGLAKIPSLGTDAIAGARWALSLQEDLCPNGKVSVGNRKGFLFEEGICLDKTDESGEPTLDMLKTIETALAGSLMTIEAIAKDGSTVQAQINPAAPLVNPVADLRSIAPTSYSACGTPLKLADDTVGGIFPNKDGNDYLRATGSIDVENCD